jgi:hypothetical protein
MLPSGILPRIPRAEFTHRNDFFAKVFDLQPKLLRSICLQSWALAGCSQVLASGRMILGLALRHLS